VPTGDRIRSHQGFDGQDPKFVLRDREWAGYDKRIH
jgi:hypothetical protein